jgi:hypothetical protein
VGNAPQWMVIGAASDSELATAKASGMTHGLVEVFWDQVQPTNGPVNATSVLANISRVVSAGMKVVLRVSMQYIPTFVDTAAVKFRRNGAVDWNPGNVSGGNARDWVWSASTRALVDDFLSKLFNQLNWATIDGVQLGGLVFGELVLPVQRWHPVVGLLVPCTDRHGPRRGSGGLPGPGARALHWQHLVG